MQKHIIDRLSGITAEEQYILVRENPVPYKQLYAKSGRFIIERRHISSLATGEATAAISMRQHPRFHDFPLHSHDFIEIMYICSGSITHSIGKEKVTLRKDDLIFLGLDTKHSILAAGEGDIGINLIISADLFESLINRLRQHSTQSAEIFTPLLSRGEAPYLVFHGDESIPICNLLENMVYSVICEKNSDGYILRQSLELLLCYLASLTERTERTEKPSYEEATKAKIMTYIQTSYSSATLSEAAMMLGLSVPYLSRWISKTFGVSFKELLMEERFNIVKELLRSTDMPIGEIITHVGYENSSYFHKEFRKRFGMTPNSFRNS
jgi:AraC-like DNA-binding protein/mannose-6-phosphate isomerase-like protein (cupin superfamily)